MKPVKQPPRHPLQFKGPMGQAELEQIKAELVSAVPDASQGTVEYAVASEVLIHLLGPEWWNYALRGSETDRYFAKDGADGPLHHFRVVAFAHHLLAIQGARNFSDQLESIRTRDLVGAAAEVAVAARATAAGHAVELVQEHGVKGADFDLLIDGELAVEVKAKEDGAPYDEGGFLNLLKTTRQQLPSSGPGVVAVQLPTHWPSIPGVAVSSGRAIEQFLRATGRVNAIVLMWGERRTLESGKTAHFMRWNRHLNASPRTDWPGIEALFPRLGPPSLRGMP